MITRTLDAGAPAAWVAGDEIYGADPKLRADLHERGIGYVLAVAKNHQVSTGTGVRTAIDLAGRLPARARQQYSARVREGGALLRPGVGRDQRPGRARMPPV